METRLTDLLEHYTKLNEEGRKKALEYMRDLAWVDEYTTREEREPAAVLTFTRGANQGETDRKRRAYVR